ncbi:MAG: prepilin-type N-terminal cleavage/methylation domain-containing protein [Pirellulales bacterium]
MIISREATRRMPTRRSLARRPGITLIETLVTIAILAMTMLIVAGALATCFRADRQLERQNAHAAPWQRLAFHFRADCHQATVIQWPAAPPAPVNPPPPVSAAAAPPTPTDQGTPPAEPAEPDTEASGPPLLVIERRDGQVVEYRAHPLGLERRLRASATTSWLRDAFRLTADSQLTITPAADAPRRLLLRWTPSPASLPRPAVHVVEAVIPAGAELRRPRRTRPARQPAGRRRRRRGAVLAVALIAFLVVALLSAVALQRVVRDHRAARMRAYQWQAEWLAISARGRARERLAADASYAGETWDVAAAEFGADDRARPGKITIVVTPVEGAPQERRVTVAARYPADETLGLLRQDEFTCSLAPSGDSP